MKNIGTTLNVYKNLKKKKKESCMFEKWSTRIL